MCFQCFFPLVSIRNLIILKKCHYAVDFKFEINIWDQSYFFKFVVLLSNFLYVLFIILFVLLLLLFSHLSNNYPSKLDPELTVDPIQKAVLSVLADVQKERLPQNSEKGSKKKTVISLSDVVMKQCRIVLRHAAAADDSKVFCNLLGRKPLSSTDNDDEGFLGSPAMVSRPLDFRTIDLRLAVGAYDGSHDAFLEDVREV